MGDRLSKSSVLSDPSVIDLIQREFIAIDLNVTFGWPMWMEGVAPWNKVFHEMPRARFAFANQAVVDATGKYLLASGDDGLLPVDASKWSSINYEPPRYMKMLQLALDRHKRILAAKADASLTEAQRSEAIARVVNEAHEDLKTLYPRSGNQFRASGKPHLPLPPLDNKK